MRRWAGVVLGVTLLAAGCAADRTGGDEEVVRVAAAASLRYALPEVTEGFTAAHPGVPVEISYGSSGALQQQVVQGAPYGLFLAADRSYPQALVDTGVIPAAEVFTYARGRLVVWAGDGSPVDPAGGIEAVTQADRIAIANPAHAPYGQAAVAALREAGLYEQVADRLVHGDSVAQAAEFVASGNAEVGLVAMSQVQAPVLRDVGRWHEVPQELFPPIEHAGTVLPAGGAAADALRDYLLSPSGQEILAGHGFQPAADPE